MNDKRKQLQNDFQHKGERNPEEVDITRKFTREEIVARFLEEKQKKEKKK